MENKHQSKPIISIIMGVFNNETLIDRCIESIISQTYKNWEFIICDDGPIDNTNRIINKYVKSYPGKIKLIKHKKILDFNMPLILV